MYSYVRMSRKEDPDPIAAALVQRRWDIATDEQKAEQGRKMAEGRWAGHVAKRPASSRNTGKPRGRPKKTAAVKKAVPKKAAKKGAK